MTVRSRKSWFAVLLLTTLFIPLTSATLTDAWSYYSFDINPPTGPYNDDSGHGNDLALNLSVYTSKNQVGYYATATDSGSAPYNNTINASGYVGNDGNLTTPVSISFWAYDLQPSQPDTFLISHTEAIFIWYEADFERAWIYLRDAVRGGYKFCSLNNFFDPGNYNFTDTLYDHIGITVLPTGALCPTWYMINGNNETASTSLTNGGPLRWSTTRNKTMLGEDTNAWIGGTENIVNFDEVGIWNRSLTADEWSDLYNGGAGYNPYSTLPPIQTGPIDNIELDTQTSTLHNYGQYFTGEDNLSIRFVYAGEVYNLSYYDVKYNNTGDFAIYAGTPSFYTWYAFSTLVQSTTATLTACNANGCNQDTFTFTVNGYGVPTLITPWLDWAVISGQTEYRSYADYFAGYDTNYSQVYFIDPDTSLVSIINTTNNQSTTSCFTIRLSGSYVFVDGASGASCSTDVIVYACDSGSCVSGTQFELLITPSTAHGSGLLAYFGTVLDWFPDSDDLSNNSKSLIIGVCFAFIVISSVFLVRQGADPRLALIVGVTVMFFSLIFFTAIGYIPIWLIVILILLLVSIGAVWVRRSVIGVG